MTMTGTKILLSLVLISGMVGGYLMMGVHYRDTVHFKRNAVEAKQQECVIVHDNVWKVIKQVAQVPERAAEKFNEIYPALMQGRYGNARGGSLLSFVTEQNPDFGSIAGLYEKLSNAIEANRVTLVRKETELLDLKREHDNFVDKTFTRHFAGSHPHIDVRTVTSTRSNTAFETGVDDDTSVFEK